MFYYWRKFSQKYYGYITVQWWMINPFPYFRRLKVEHERREWFSARDLSREYGYIFNRGKRNPHAINPWDLEKVSSRMSMSSWKELNKCRRQWQKKKYNKYIN